LEALGVFAAVSLDESVPAGDEERIGVEAFKLSDDAPTWGGSRLGEAGCFVGEGVAEGVPKSVVDPAVMR
jgi:hypothetical protein